MAPPSIAATVAKASAGPATSCGQTPARRCTARTALNPREGPLAEHALGLDEQHRDDHREHDGVAEAGRDVSGGEVVEDADRHAADDGSVHTREPAQEDAGERPEERS